MKGGILRYEMDKQSGGKTAPGLLTVGTYSVILLYF